MNYAQLLQSSDRVRVGLIGTGAFGNSFLFQTRSIPKIEVPIVCDRQAKIARQACLQAGLEPDRLAVCSSTREAQSAIEAGQTAIVEDAMIMMELPLDVVVEATGMPEAGAIHGKMALEHGKHVVMVNKETDSIVGPILNKLALDSGLVYSPADGDQPSLLIGLISWAAALGFTVVCAGKSSEHDFVYNVDENTISNRTQSVNLSETGGWPLWDIPPGQTQTVIERRNEALRDLPRVAVADLCEMAIVINSTGYGYDSPTLRAPIARLTELPEVLSHREQGGILHSEGVIDTFNCLRRTDEVSIAGGVFVVIACHDKITWELLRSKGHIVNQAGTRALIFRPYHLLEVETATTILSVGMGQQLTGGPLVKPRVDLAIKATKPLKAGQRLSMLRNHAIPGLAPEIAPARPTGPENLIPFYMAAENRLKTDVPAGTFLTYDMVDYDARSPLWTLKQLQDEVFLNDVNHN